MTWRDFDLRSKSSIAILPVGAVEPHGPHLPLSSDTLISDYLARTLADSIDAYVLPVLGYGVATPSYRLGGDFPGVLAISGETFTRLVVDILSSLGSYGVQEYIILNSAIDNVSFLCEAARIFRGLFPDTRVMVINWWDVIGERFRDDLANETGVARQDDHHAAMVESSLVMHIAPTTVQTEFLHLDGNPDGETLATRRMSYHMFPLPSDAATESGIVYQAAEASSELGKRALDRILYSLTAAVHLEFHSERSS